MFSKGITSFRNKTTETTRHLKVLHVFGLNVSSCVALFGAERLVTNSASVFSVVETDQTIQILVLLCKASYKPKLCHLTTNVYFIFSYE